MRRRHFIRFHLGKPYADTAFGQLPCRFTSGEACADDSYLFLRHFSAFLAVFFRLSGFVPVVFFL